MIALVVFAVLAGLGLGYGLQSNLRIRGLENANAILLQHQRHLLDRVQATSLAQVHAFDEPKAEPSGSRDKSRTVSDTTGLIRGKVPVDILDGRG